MRSIWTGTIGVSMLSFPVKLGPAVSEGKLPLHRVRRSDGSRIRQQNVAEADGAPVGWEDVTMGYAAPDGRTVLVEKDDLARAFGDKSRHAKVLQFTDPVTVPRTAHETSYYVQPGDGGEKPYALLAAAMTATGKAAVVSIAVRQREALALLYATPDGYLVLERLAWGTSVQQPDFAAPPATLVSAPELAQAQQLVAALDEPFDWSSFTDASEEKLAAVIQAKLETGQAVGTPAPRTEAAVTAPQDIMAAIEASIKASRATAPKPARKPRARKPSAAKEEKVA